MASSSSSSSSTTTNPIRIYRRCCQLRESPILKKVTEQLGDGSGSMESNGVVDKLDLTGYWLHLSDLVTLGDFLAVVPVREILLEDSGLGDEGLRILLAGLLAAKRPRPWRRKKSKPEYRHEGGVVERVVLKNNKLGPDGWKHVSLFLYLCRSLKYLDISQIPFPKEAAAAGVSGVLANGKPMPRGISDIFSTALSDRLGGATLEMVNIGETEPSMEQLGKIVDGATKCGVRRLGLAHNHLDEQGVATVARYLDSGKCEGLDLGGNDLVPYTETICQALQKSDRLGALSLAGCCMTPSVLSKILPCLVGLKEFRFVDLSHNQELFQSTPSAVGLLRR